MERTTGKDFDDLLPEETGSDLLSEGGPIPELELPDDTEGGRSTGETAGDSTSKGSSGKDETGSSDSGDLDLTGEASPDDDLDASDSDDGSESSSSSGTSEGPDGSGDSGSDYDGGYGDDHGGRTSDSFGRETKSSSSSDTESSGEKLVTAAKSAPKVKEESSSFERSSPSDFTTRADTRTTGTKEDEEIAGSDGVDIIKSKKGDDEVDGAAGDDWLRGGHGDDSLDGGAGSDTVDGEKGDDTLTYTFSENDGSTDYYDGGKGSDTLVLRMTSEEYETYQEEITNLENWVEENANSKASTGHAFNDASAKGGAHPVFETSFGLHIRNFETVEVEILDSPEPDPVIVTEPDPAPVIEPDPEPTPIVEEIKVDLGATTGDTVPVNVKLAPGTTVTLSVDVAVTELPSKFDVFMVQDLSGSFYDDLPNVKEQLPTLIDGLNAEYDVAFGVGSFVDKPMAPFGYEGYDYAYKTDQAISSDTATVTDAMNALRTYSGSDWPESQLEALVQVALRGEEIGFRDGTQKFVVLSTDAPFHVAGDYEGAVANDLDTELEDEDYPDPADVGALLEAAGIIPIFAVTSPYLTTYQDLVDSWGFGSVTELASDSSNIMDTITSGLTDASLDLTLDVSDDDYGLVSGMTPEVYEDAGPGTYTFDITLEIPTDTDSYGSDSLTISIPGYGDINLDVEIASVDMAGDETNETLSGDAGANAIYGEGGDDNLDGEGGNDTLTGGTGSDTLTGGLGDDTFVFEDGDGSDVITDFGSDDMTDVIDLRRTSAVSSYSDVIAAASQVGEDTVIDFGSGDSITLLGVDTDSLSEEDFLV
ncbi:hypothetical protein [Kiloniella sp.]|uniref:hypothetical protein n=1 Tax=Kiloniella sp. TaxID=1938587 RepID=UPI003B019A04